MPQIAIAEISGPEDKATLSLQLLHRSKSDRGRPFRRRDPTKTRAASRAPAKATACKSAARGKDARGSCFGGTRAEHYGLGHWFSGWHPYRMLRLVLLALEGQILSRCSPIQSVVFGLRTKFRNRGAQCAVLCLAHDCDWLGQATGDFIYTIKVCELITHIRRFDETETLIRDFGYIADLLGGRMGCFLFQLPSSIRYDPTLLKTVLKQLDPRHRNVLEFRHKSWWNEDVYAAFRAAGVIFCSCSGPRLPDELVKTADDIYVRFHGTKNWYRHDYSDDELAIWAERIRESGAKNVWVYFNNDRDGHSIKNAKMLKELSGNKGGLPA